MPTGPLGNGAIPPLENGDHLTREGFERRYDAMPGLEKAELIEGVVYMPSPVRHRRQSHLVDGPSVSGRASAIAAKEGQSACAMRRESPIMGGNAGTLDRRRECSWGDIDIMATVTMPIRVGPADQGRRMTLE